MASSSRDEEVQSTNDDAAASKCSAVQYGYWRDPYISFFTKPCSRKPPEINRGYYARVKGVEILVRQFLKKSMFKCQVINLGAGSDTAFWNWCDQNMTPYKWIELDFEPVVSRKIRAIRSKKILLDKLKIGVGASDTSESEVRVKANELHSQIYHLVSCDLRDIYQIETALAKCGVNYLMPTLFICECVLVYIEATASSNIIRWIAEKFSQTFFINYEQVNMADRFGEVMIENLMSRGCALVGVKHCQNIQTQFDRFQTNGWHGVDGGDMLQIYKSLPQDDVQRTEKLEFLDDLEMLTQLFSHYCIVWAYINSAEKSSETQLDFSEISLFYT